MKKMYLAGLLLSFFTASYADWSLPAWVSNHMVLPANRLFTVSGTATPGTTVTIRLGSQKKQATADLSGDWLIEMDPMPASFEPQDFIVSSSLRSSVDHQKFTDVLIGDIWLCSGQSNMQLRVKDSDEADEAVRDIKSFSVRCFNGNQWVVVNPDNVGGISAVGAFFAMEMACKQSVPVGIFVAARGGTGIEAWIPAQAFPETRKGERMRLLVNDPEVLQAAADDAADFKPWGEHRLAKWGLGRAVPASLYETLIHPFGDLPIRGMVWYQGESNSDNVEEAGEYRLWLMALISTYRELWKSSELPVIIIQLPEYDPGSDRERAGWAMLQDVQASVAEETSDAAIVNIKDLGDLSNIHPRRKKEVGARAARTARTLLNNK